MFKFLSAALIALALSAPASAQEISPPEDGPGLLNSLGRFFRDGLSAPRTAADLVREEERAREAERTREPTTVKPPVEAAPEPVPVAAPIRQQPVDPEPASAQPSQPPSQPPQAPPEAIARPAAAPSTPAPAPPPQRPRPIVVPSSPAAEPIRPADRIAGTATLDQAIRLGGSADLYTRRPARPAAN